MEIQILDQAAIEARLRRMAYELYERNYTASSLVVVGIDVRGSYLADRVCDYLREIAPQIAVEQVHAQLHRQDKAGTVGNIPVELSVPLETLAQRDVVVVDDVLYGGNTMLNVVSSLLSALPKRIETLVLIDRGHRLMPISPNYVGLELATSLQQHVSFRILSDQSCAAFLQ